MIKCFVYQQRINKNPNKKLRKSTFEKEQIFLALYLKNKREALKETYNRIVTESISHSIHLSQIKK